MDQNPYEAYLHSCMNERPRQLPRGVNPVADALIKQADELALCIESNVLPLAESLAYRLAMQVHNNWVAEKGRQGYVWGPVRNDSMQKGQKTHPLMVPFCELSFDDVKYDLVAVTGTLLMAAQIVLDS